MTFWNTYLARFEHPERFAKREFTNSIRSQASPPLQHIRCASGLHLVLHLLDGKPYLFFDERKGGFKVALRKGRGQKSPVPPVYLNILYVD